MLAVKCIRPDILCDGQRITPDLITEFRAAIQPLPEFCRRPHLYSLSLQEFKDAHLEADPLRLLS